MTRARRNVRHFSQPCSESFRLCTTPPLEPVGGAERNVHGMNNLNANLHPPAVLRGRNVEAYASQRLGDKGQRLPKTISGHSLTRAPPQQFMPVSMAVQFKPLLQNIFSMSTLTYRGGSELKRQGHHVTQPYQDRSKGH